MAYTTDYRHTGTRIGMQPIASISTTAQHPLGTTCKAVDVGSNQNGEGEFIYLLGAASTIAGSPVTYNQDDYSTALLAEDAIGSVAFAMGANVASSYGWYQIKGKAVGKGHTALADNQSVGVLSGTPGTIDDTFDAGDQIWNCKSASALDGPATGFAEFEIDYPSVNDTIDAT